MCIYIHIVIFFYVSIYQISIYRFFYIYIYLYLYPYLYLPYVGITSLLEFVSFQMMALPLGLACKDVIGLT